MVKNEKMSYEYYGRLKFMLYDLVSQYDKNKLLKFFKEKVFYKTQEEKEIIINTILHPEDMRILDALTFFHGEEKISYELDIPVKIVREKAKEFSRYKIWELFKKNEEIKNFAISISNIQIQDAEATIKRFK